MISLDLALRHRVVRPAADMSDAVVLEPLTKLARHVGWTVIAQQPWPMQNLDLVQTCPPQRHLQRIGYVGCRHGGAQLPGQDVAREVIEHGGQIEPAPADDLQIGEVGLPKLVWGGRRIGDRRFDLVRDLVPDPPWSRLAILQSFDPTLLVSAVPVVERRSRDPDWSQCPAD